MSRGRSVELLVEEQARRWQMGREGPRVQVARPTVALSSLPGAPGEEVARRVSDALGYDLFDREIILEIAHSAHLSERVVAALDERDRSWLSDWLHSLTPDASLSTYGYLHRLGSVIGAIARQGGAVIVGHGAYAMLSPPAALRVLVVAPLEARVAAVAAQGGVRPEVARRQIAEEQARRQAFLAKHFHVTLGDPSGFDLVVNTQVLGSAGAADAVCAVAPTLTRSRHH